MQKGPKHKYICDGCGYLYRSTAGWNCAKMLQKQDNRITQYYVGYDVETPNWCPYLSRAIRFMKLQNIKMKFG